MQTLSILMVHFGGICYDSTLYFENSIGRQLTKLGHSVSHLMLSKETAYSILEKELSKPYDIIFDINTTLPALQNNTGDNCLKHFGGSVWHFILDHPLYHHDVLKEVLDNYNVVCLDEKHVQFIRTYYPHIQTVKVLPIAAHQTKKKIPFANRNYDLIFTGTYTDPDNILQKALSQDAELILLFRQTVDFLLEHSGFTQEEALLTLYPNTVDIPAVLQMNYLADVYLQACIREELLLQCLRQGLSITVFGHGWDAFSEKHIRTLPKIRELLTAAGEIPYQNMADIYGNARISLNQTPWFKAGMHDRVPLALLNGCISVTEENSFLKGLLKNDEGVRYYSLDALENIGGILASLCQKQKETSLIAARGQKFAEANFTWEHWVQSFLSGLETGINR